MNRYMLLHYGFEPPTPEIMEGWSKWFELVADRAEENGGFHGAAREITHDGTEELTMGPDAITGFSVIQAESIEDAEAIARQNPFIKAIRVYEISQQG